MCVRSHVGEVGRRGEEEELEAAHVAQLHPGGGGDDSPGEIAQRSASFSPGVGGVDFWLEEQPEQKRVVLRAHVRSE